MAASSHFLRKAAALLTLTAVIGLGPLPGELAETSGKAQAQSVNVGGSSYRLDRHYRHDRIRRSGVIFGGHASSIVPAFRDPALKRLGQRNRGSVKAWSRDNRQRRRRAFARKHKNPYFKRRDLLFVERQREIRQRNREIARESARRDALRGPVIISPDFIGDGSFILFDDDTLVINSRTRVTTPCPANHNCGYRLYTDGTGPRIIRPGDSIDYDYDGISGPKVITLDDIN